MLANLSQIHFELFCDDYGDECFIPKGILEFLLNSKILYCCTLDSKQVPHITPVIYFYEMNRCTIRFIIGKESKKAKNLAKNAFASFTTDVTHQSNPFLNTGITITSFVELSGDPEVLRTYSDRLHRKYSSHFIPELTDSARSNSEICVSARIAKVVYWKGPYFQRFSCKNRMPIVHKLTNSQDSAH